MDYYLVLSLTPFQPYSAWPSWAMVEPLPARLYAYHLSDQWNREAEKCDSHVHHDDAHPCDCDLYLHDGSDPPDLVKLALQSHHKGYSSTPMDLTL
ncbi:hypothetical protein [Rubritalea tangerina]|uniref:hypothetical protein n=1 Tax=Rubritalea tangerina TaxID=430798 RepID=UPI00361393F2